MEASHAVCLSSGECKGGNADPYGYTPLPSIVVETGDCCDVRPWVVSDGGAANLFGWEKARGIAPGFVVSCHVVAAPLFSDPSLCVMFIMSGVGIVELRVRRGIPAGGGSSTIQC